MRVLVDMVHPADVLFFVRPLRMLADRGDEVLIASRDKDVTVDLLDSFGLAHKTVSRAGTGVMGLGLELIRRDIAIWRMVRQFRPDVMVGFGGVAISHIGWLTGIPAISFYDSETARLQTRLTWPFIARLYVPDSYAGPVPKGRTVRVRGTKDLSYFHPSGFQAEREIAIRAGLEPDRDNFFLRTVSWRANHDLGKSGWTEETLAQLVAILEPLGRIHLSSEAPLPESLRRHAYSGSPRDIHHLMAHCRLYVGESVTMACEAATLGTPAVYSGHDFPGYLRALEQAGLVATVPAGAVDDLPRAVRDALASPAHRFSDARERWLAHCPDWARVVVEAIDEAASPSAQGPTAPG